MLNVCGSYTWFISSNALSIWLPQGYYQAQFKSLKSYKSRTFKWSLTKWGFRMQRHHLTSQPDIGKVYHNIHILEAIYRYTYPINEVYLGMLASRNQFKATKMKAYNKTTALYFLSDVWQNSQIASLNQCFDVLPPCKNLATREQKHKRKVNCFDFLHFLSLFKIQETWIYTGLVVDW